MLVGADLKYARLRRESITVYYAGETQSFLPQPVNGKDGQTLKSKPGIRSKERVRRVYTQEQPNVISTPRIRINVSGTIIETFASTLSRFPNSLLGNPDKRQKFWNEERGEYVLYRHIPSFEAIFQFYQTGVLHRPFIVPLFTFVEEIEFYELDGFVVDEYKKKEGFLVDKKPKVSKEDLKTLIWLSMEYPKSSRLARLYNTMSMFVIILSVASFCAETMPKFSHVHCHNVSYTNADGQIDWHEIPNMGNVFFIIENTCVGWFTIELFIRFICCPQKILFLCNKLNMIDFITVLPYAIVVIVIAITQSCYIAKRSASVLMFRLLRVFRIFKLTRHFRALQIFVLCLRYSIRELRLFFFLICIACIVLAVGIYVAEIDHPDTMIKSIPEGIWWAVATMTTVGYGDVYPVGVYGKIVGVFSFVVGCVVIALPTPPIVTNFNHFYRVETGRNCDKNEAA